MSKRTMTLDGSIKVEGPQMEPTGRATLNLGIVLAQSRALAHGCAGSWFVRDESDTVRYAVTRLVDGTVITSEIGDTT